MSIYAYSYNNELLYIGSTMDLKDREKKHKEALKYAQGQPFHRYLRERNLTVKDLEKEVVDTAIFEKEPLKMLERMMIEYWEPLCNCNMPGRSKKEWNEDNKDCIKEYMKEYREANKDKAKEYMKEWYQANKDKAKEQSKKYREANRDEILTKQNQKKITQRNNIGIYYMTDNYIETYISSIENINTKETFRRFLLNLSKEIDPYLSSEELGTLLKIKKM